MTIGEDTQRWRAYWDEQSPHYDRGMQFFDRIGLGINRRWACDRAEGDVLEVAIGTGLNLPLYPAGVRLTGIDWSEAMLAHARRRAEDMGLDVRLDLGDARALPYPDASMDTVVATYSLCAIPDPEVAVAEMLRVLRPGGRLLLADHVVSTFPPLRWLQAGTERFTVPRGGEHFRRRPYDLVAAQGAAITARRRSGLGTLERLAAVKPEAGAGPSAI